MTKRVTRVWFWAVPHKDYTQIEKVTEYSDYTEEFEVIKKVKTYADAYAIAKQMNEA